MFCVLQKLNTWSTKSVIGEFGLEEYGELA